MTDAIEVVGEVTEPQVESQLAEPVQELKKEEPQEQQHEPAEGSPRWNEVYGKWKDSERQIEAMQADMEAIKEHNKALSEAMVSVEDKSAEINKPDMIEEPEKYEEWLTDKITRKLRGVQRNTPAEATNPVNPQANARLQAQEQAMWADHADYYDVASKVMQEMKVNPALNMRIRGADNPARELYNYHQEKQGIKKEQTKENLSKSYVETDNSPPPPAPQGKLTDQQRRVANALGISEDNYKKQLEYLEKESEVIV
jgi:hypothetical protein